MAGSGLEISIDTGLTLLALVVLETVLSADNAVALAALVQPLSSPQRQQQALNWGLTSAFGLRIALLLAATWIIQFWQFELLGALYLLWIAGKHFWARFQSSEATAQPTATTQPTFCHIISLIAFTDLAFSLDSVTTAVALSERFWLVLAGCMMGVIALRFLAGLFVRWLAEFAYLQDAAYLTICCMGLKLLCKALQPDLVPPDWSLLAMVTILFTWGFSKRSSEVLSEATLERMSKQVPFD